MIHPLPQKVEKMFLHTESGQGGKFRLRVLTFKVVLDHLTGGFNTLLQYCSFVVVIESLSHSILSVSNSIYDSQDWNRGPIICINFRAEFSFYSK